MQATHGLADRLAHPLDLVLAALVERELDPLRAELSRARRRRRTVVQLDTVRRRCERLGRRRALDVGLVDLRYAVARMGEPMRQIAVVREDERARRVCVETSDRHDARVGRDQLHHRPTAMGVTRRRHDSGGLVQEHVREALRLYLLAVDLHDVAPADHRV